MKIAFSTYGWQRLSWQEICALALEMRFDGIEIYDVDAPCFEGVLGNESARTARKLREKGLEIACVDAVSNLSDPDTEKVKKDILHVIDSAARLHAPYVRLRAQQGEADEEKIRALLASVLPAAEEAKVTLLVETAGVYADTKKLAHLLDSFADDSLGALWDIHHTVLRAGESPDDTVKNLGAYIRHTHIKDSRRDENGEIEYCLMGEGTLPAQEVFDALRSLNYAGFCSMEMRPDWLGELGDEDIVFTHFAAFMKRFDRVPEWQNHLYRNKAGTGRYVWKKDALIPETFPQVLDRMVKEFPDQLAFKYTTLDYTRTYAQFRDDVDEFARALIALGVKPGYKVAVWATNVPQWYIAFWATTKIGAILVTVNTAYKIAEAEYLFRQSDTHTLIMVESYRDSNYADVMRRLAPEMTDTQPGKPLHCKKLPFLRNIITVGFSMPGCLTWEEALPYADKTPIEEVHRRMAAIRGDDVCNMQYTSGTTGFPKGVMLTHYNVVNNGKCIGDRMDLSTADRMMIQVPMFHCFGMVLAMTASMTHGATLHPIPYFSPKPSLACIHNERITAFHGVPTMFIALLAHKDFEKTDFSYMRTGIMAGSPCPIKVMQEVVDRMHMKEITIVYGQTEASPGCTMSSTDDSLEVRVSTVGRPLPEIECKIVDPETGEELPDNVTGEFVARGYNIMKGYYKMPKATASAIDKDGWLHTGDLACRTPEGNFRITGRLKDMIIRGGENIYPKEIEEFIYTHEKVSDVQVIGVPDRQYGEEIMAWVVLKKGEEMTEAELKAFVAANMAKHKVPRYVTFVDAFPTNAAGKILKYKMREMAVEMLNLKKDAAIETA